MTRPLLLCQLLIGHELRVHTTFVKKLLVVTRLHDAAVVDDVDDVTTLYGGQPMGNDDTRSALSCVI